MYCFITLIFLITFHGTTARQDISQHFRQLQGSFLVENEIGLRHTELRKKISKATSPIMTSPTSSTLEKFSNIVAIYPPHVGYKLI